MKRKYFLAAILILLIVFGFKIYDLKVEAIGSLNTPQLYSSKSNENYLSFANVLNVSSQQANAVCPNPNKPCNNKNKTFADWELSFKMPAKLQSNKTYKSSPFYAVILKRYEEVEDCDGGEYIEAAEKDRKNEQARYPAQKVFASYACPNMDAVNYDFQGRMDAKRERVLIDNFIAIYAGATKAEGDELLQTMKSKYPKAMLKKMTAVYEIIEQ